MAGVGAVCFSFSHFHCFRPFPSLPLQLPDSSSFQLMGDVVNLSARLMTCRSGAPGVVIDRPTYLACQNSAEAVQAFRFEQMEPLKLKGMSKPVQAYIVLKSARLSIPDTERNLARMPSKVRRNAFLLGKPSCLHAILAPF